RRFGGSAVRRFGGSAVRRFGGSAVRQLPARSLSRTIRQAPRTRYSPTKAHHPSHGTTQRMRDTTARPWQIVVARTANLAHPLK
ncbi:hypothetical protein LV178_13460, partial [Burkholderia mallei]|nr:hypothetical protein [Burkholderia mallei]